MFSQNVEEGVDWSYLLGLCLLTHIILKNSEIAGRFLMFCFGWGCL